LLAGYPPDVRPNNGALMSDKAISKPDSEPTYVLSVGAVYGGPEQQLWRDGVNSLMQRVATMREGVASQLNVNVVFHVPGSVLSPDYEGVRTGSFSKRDSLLMIQVALPLDPPGDVGSCLRAAIVSAVDEAEAWAVRKRKGFDTTALHELVRRL
jgi:hypothetical protein